MAQILPAFSDDLQASGASPAEWMTLKRLENGLPNDWLVFHNIRWTQAWDHGTNVGEIDFCVLSPTGKVIVIEQKNGELIERPRVFSNNTQKVRRMSEHRFSGPWMDCTPNLSA